MTEIKIAVERGHVIITDTGRPSDCNVRKNPSFSLSCKKQLKCPNDLMSTPHCHQGLDRNTSRTIREYQHNQASNSLRKSTERAQRRSRNGLCLHLWLFLCASWFTSFGTLIVQIFVMIQILMNTVHANQEPQVIQLVCFSKLCAFADGSAIYRSFSCKT